MIELWLRNMALMKLVATGLHVYFYSFSVQGTKLKFDPRPLMKNENRLKLGAFHHQMHHRYFECCYGSLEIPWDKLFGSFHDGTSEADEKMKARCKKDGGLSFISYPRCRRLLQRVRAQRDSMQARRCGKYVWRAWCSRPHHAQGVDQRRCSGKFQFRYS